MTAIELAETMHKPEQAVSVARQCNREAVRYARNDSPRAQQIAWRYRRERTFFMLLARKLKK